MTKYLFFTLALCLSITTYAQLEKNTWMLGGQINFTSEEINNDDMLYSFEFQPNVGYFFIDKLSTGLEFNFRATSTDSGNNDVFWRSYIVSPFARYYLLKQESPINLFAQVNGSVGFSNLGNHSSSKSYGYGLKAGTVFFLNNIVGIEFSVNYSSLWNKSKQTEAINQNKELLIGIGIQVHLERY